MKRKLAAVLSAAALALAGAVATAPVAHAAACNNFSSSLGQCQNVQMNIGGTTYSVDWYLPNANASALMNLQHGFSRNCAHLRGTSKAIMEKGVMVFCVNTDMTGGNPGFADTLGDALNARTIVPPAGKPLPQKYIVGGHSAGGHFASELGERLNALGYPDLKGAVLFDPVAAGDFTANLTAISAGDTRPVLSVAARPSVINLSNNSFGALESLPSTYVQPGRLPGRWKLPHRRRGREHRRARHRRLALLAERDADRTAARLRLDLGQGPRDGDEDRCVLVRERERHLDVRLQGA
jgi:acetyl esterase/lipase